MVVVEVGWNLCPNMGEFIKGESRQGQQVLFMKERRSSAKRAG